MKIIGIDFGSTITKVVYTDKNAIKAREIFYEKNVENVIISFLKNKNLRLESIDQFVLTGIGSLRIKNDLFGIKTMIVNEIDAIGNSVDDDNCLIISIGTGTAFVMKKNKTIKHIGGSGLGGRTLTTLAKLISNENNIETIKKSLETGELNKVDLKIKDVCTEEFSNLNMDTTVSNFGKIENATESDLTFGIFNMIIESIGVMGAMAIKNTLIKNIYVIGTMTKLPRISYILDNVSKLHENVNFIVPNNAQFGVVEGAIRTLK